MIINLLNFINEHSGCLNDFLTYQVKNRDNNFLLFDKMEDYQRLDDPQLVSLITCKSTTDVIDWLDKNKFTGDIATNLRTIMSNPDVRLMEVFNKKDTIYFRTLNVRSKNIKLQKCQLKLNQMIF